MLSPEGILVCLIMFMTSLEWTGERNLALHATNMIQNKINKQFTSDSALGELGEGGGVFTTIGVQMMMAPHRAVCSCVCVCVFFMSPNKSAHI